MSTALDIITDAYRESNIIGAGVTPNDAQKNEALRRLNTLISGALGFEIGEMLAEWMVGTTNINAPDMAGLSEARWTRPPANVRLLLNATTPQTIFFPPRPSDGARMAVRDVLGDLSAHPVTLDGNGFNIEGAPSYVVNTDGMGAVWFFRADLSNWVRVAALALTDPMPFPHSQDDAFVTLLAMRLNPRYGRSMDPASAAWLDRSLTALRARYKQRVVTRADLAVLNMSSIGPGSYARRLTGGLGLIG